MIRSARRGSGNKMMLVPLLQRLGRAALALLASAAFLGVAYYANFVWRGPELKSWHRADLDAEFTASDYDSGAITTVAEYRALENRLFAELQRNVYRQVPPADRLRFNRFARGSASDPGRWRTNWNRTFLMKPAGEPIGGVLLLHGLT